MWFGTSVVECRDSMSEALGSNPGQAGYFLTTSESKESTRPLVLTRKNLVRASGVSFFNCRTNAKWQADE